MNQRIEAFIVNKMEQVEISIDNWLSRRGAFLHLRDDLISEGYAALIKLCRERCIEEDGQVRLPGDSNSLIYTTVCNAAVDFVRGNRSFEQLNESTVFTRDESGAVDAMDTLLSACKRPGDEEIIRGRVAGKTLTEIGDELGLHHTTISRRLKVMRGRLS